MPDQNPGVYTVEVRAAWDSRQPGSPGVVRVTVPRQQIGPVDFQWLGPNPHLEGLDDFTVVRRVGHFELYRPGGGKRVYEFDPPLRIEVPYDAADWRRASSTPYGRLSLAYWHERADRPRWIRFNENDDGSTFEVHGDERGGLLLVELRRWKSCDMACGG